MRYDAVAIVEHPPGAVRLIVLFYHASDEAVDVSRQSVFRVERAKELRKITWMMQISFRIEVEARRLNGQRSLRFSHIEVRALM
jgi:hypothetical protein